MGTEVEKICDDEGVVAVIVRGGYAPDETVFLTDPEDEQQMGVLVYAEGDVVQAHDHSAPMRELKTCPECLIIRSGSCEMTLFDRDRKKMSSRVLRESDVVLLLAGGHEFRALNACKMMCVRAGAFPGTIGKNRF